MDHSAQAKTRILWQYRNGASYRAWIDTLPAIAQTELEQPSQAIADILDIDNVSGKLLDIAGRIAGVDRPVVPQGSTIPGPKLPDSYFRPVIKAKIARNNSNVEIDSVIDSIDFITGTIGTTIDDRQNMAFVVILGQTPSQEVQDVIEAYNPVPRPQGVKLSAITIPVNDEYFGFQNDPNSTPYGVAPYAGRIEV